MKSGTCTPVPVMCGEMGMEQIRLDFTQQFFYFSCIEEYAGELAAYKVNFHIQILIILQGNCRHLMSRIVQSNEVYLIIPGKKFEPASGVDRSAVC
jgi:hypothetical protein